MSSPLVDLPSRPERARIKQSEKTAIEATGFQPILQNRLKKFKKRRRQQPIHEASRKPSSPELSNLPKDSIFTHFHEKTEEKDGASCVFLLWGSEHSESFKTWAVDVPIADVEDEYEIFKSLRKTYDEELGLPRRCLSFRKFSRLKPVTVCSYRLMAYLPVLRLNIVPIDLSSLQKILSLR